MSWDVTRLDHWLPARRHPETYPGDRPPGSYLLLDEVVCPVLLDDPDAPVVVTPGGEAEALDAVLERAGLPATSDRVAVLAYGGNRNPATLRIKFANYGYRCPGSAVAVPVLRGAIRGADVAACGLSGQGYLYGDLLVDPDLVGETRCEAWVVLADPDQLRVLNDSEIGTGDYAAARFPGVEVGRPLGGPVLGYTAHRPCFVSPELGRPLAFRSIDAERRALPEMTPMEMLDHVLGVLGLRDRARAVAGRGVNGDLALAVAHYMNRNWWRSFTGDEPEPGYGEVLTAVGEGLAARSLAGSSASLLADRGLLMTDAEAQHPDASLTWGRL
ncbi:MAG TPA: hypothetical protein VGW10_19290 [Solirubrobacteraceae bacterium]|nr:hypothetical protein [Solirubrobacteraceae bacterium]